VRISVYLPLLLSLALPIATPLLATRLAPALATRVLTASAAIAAAASTWGLTLLALTLIARSPAVGEGPPTGDPVPTLVAALAMLVLVAGGLRAGRTARVRRHTEQDLRAVCDLSHAGGELAIIADATPHALAVPGRPGHILISTGLLRATSPEDRTVVLAHERAHLHHQHHRYRAIADLAAAVNPLLRPTRDAVAFLVERWADETAAAAIGSRQHTAASLAKVRAPHHTRYRIAPACVSPSRRPRTSPSTARPRRPVPSDTRPRRHRPRRGHHTRGGRRDDRLPAHGQPTPRYLSSHDGNAGRDDP